MNLQVIRNSLENQVCALEIKYNNLGYINWMKKMKTSKELAALKEKLNMVAQVHEHQQNQIMEGPIFTVFNEANRALAELDRIAAMPLPVKQNNPNYVPELLQYITKRQAAMDNLSLSLKIKLKKFMEEVGNKNGK